MLTNFFKTVFTWWNNQTVGTFLFTSIYGIKVGNDSFGNCYYKNKNDSKRWIIYNGEIESSKIPPEWHLWIHRTSEITPENIKFVNYTWIKPHKKNKTGTSESYHPKNSSIEKKAAYKKWQPDS